MSKTADSLKYLESFLYFNTCQPSKPLYIKIFHCKRGHNRAICKSCPYGRVVVSFRL